MFCVLKVFFARLQAVQSRWAERKQAVGGDTVQKDAAVRDIRVYPAIHDLREPYQSLFGWLCAGADPIRYGRAQYSVDLPPAGLYHPQGLNCRSRQVNGSLFHRKKERRGYGCMRPHG